VKNDAYELAAQPRAATARIDGTVQNHTGGAVFEIGDAARARRFLVLGSAGGTYYQGERDITRENYDVLTRMAQTAPAALAALIRDVSVRGIAPKVDPQLFGLAVMTSQPGEARALAFDIFQDVVRTGSHLLMWARYNKALGGKVGRAWRRAVSTWYTSRDADALAYQLAKYKQRDGWAQRDLIDMSHALAGRVPIETVGALRWARGTMDENGPLPLLLRTLDHEGVTVPELIGAGASWEMLPDAALRESKTWDTLIANRRLPLTAATRQLARMTEIGVFDPYFSNETAGRLKALFSDEDAIRKARVHPLNVLLAIRAYASGSTRSGLSYRPIMGVFEALEPMFYTSFETAAASGKRHLVGIDISASMTNQNALGLTSHEVATVLAMKILRTEPQSLAVGFASEIRELGMTKTMDLQSALRTTQGAFGATNPGALIEYAWRHKIPVDTFVVITDNEVNRGRHVPDVLKAYRSEMGIDAKLAVLACTATNFSIADPNDPGMLDIAGFGSDVPALLTEFSRGL
jgi:60 kDa SS-A/Ro ribonucleoprotein